MNVIVDLEELHKELKLTDSQKRLLSDAIEKLLAVYGGLSRRGLPNDDYYGAVADGMNHAYKVVNGIDDDYNCLDK